MKLNMLTVVALLAGCLLSQAAEYGTLQFFDINDDESITLNAGDRIEFLATYQESDEIVVFAPDLPPLTWNIKTDLIGPNRQVIVGPCVVLMTSPSGVSASYASYKITRAGTENSSSYITVPSNPSGNFELKLQTSTDLETWSSTTPGIFPYGDNAKFFRLVMETP